MYLSRNKILLLVDWSLATTPVDHLFALIEQGTAIWTVSVGDAGYGS